MVFALYSKEIAVEFWKKSNLFFLPPLNALFDTQRSEEGFILGL